MSRRKPLTKNEALKLAWTRGLLSYKLYDYQQELYDLISKSTELKTVLNVSRRYGKTFCLLLYCLEYGLRNPGKMIRFASPFKVNLKKIIHPIMSQIMGDCPTDYRPWFKSQENAYILYNGSEIHLAGVNNGHCDDLRGQVCHLGVIDEAGDVDELNYLYRSILLPQCMTCNGRVIMSSTPSKIKDHDFYNLCEEAINDGTYFMRTVFENKFMTPEKLETYIKESGGRESATFKREYLCQFVTETEKLITPEWDDKFIQEIERDEFFQYYHKYTYLDLGVKRHYTCGLFAWYDFKHARLVIDDEFTMLDMTTQTLCNKIKEYEKKVFGIYPVRLRIADNNNPLLINDMSYLHQLPVVATNKDTLEAMINELRMFISAGKVIINPRCQFLINNLRHGTWDKTRERFAESKLYGHFDALAAIMYGVRNLDQTTNPIPHLLHKNDSEHFIMPQDKEVDTQSKRALMQMFGTMFRKDD